MGRNGLFGSLSLSHLSRLSPFNFGKKDFLENNYAQEIEKTPLREKMFNIFVAENVKKYTTINAIFSSNETAAACLKFPFRKF